MACASFPRTCALQSEVGIQLGLAQAGRSWNRQLNRNETEKKLKWNNTENDSEFFFFFLLFVSFSILPTQSWMLPFPSFSPLWRRGNHVISYYEAGGMQLFLTLSLILLSIFYYYYFGLPQRAEPNAKKSILYADSILYPSLQKNEKKNSK